MDFLGMGPLEVLIILLIAFIFLGPERMVDAARLLGKAVKDVRRMATDLSQAVVVEDEPGPDDPAKPGGGSQTSSDSPSPKADKSSADGEGPVAFQPAGDATAQEDTDPTPERDKT